MKQFRPIGRLEWLRHYLAVLMPFALVMAVGAMAHYYALHQTERVKREASELLNIGLARSATYAAAAVLDDPEVAAEARLAVESLEGSLSYRR